jgi:hypothetical protein
VMDHGDSSAALFSRSPLQTNRALKLEGHSCGIRPPVRFPSALLRLQSLDGWGISYFCCSFWAAIWPAAVLELFSWA